MKAAPAAPKEEPRPAPAPPKQEPQQPQPAPTPQESHASAHAPETAAFKSESDTKSESDAKAGGATKVEVVAPEPSPTAPPRPEPAVIRSTPPPVVEAKPAPPEVKAAPVEVKRAPESPEESLTEAEPLAGQALEWARLLTSRPSLGGEAGEVRAALGLWLKEWRLLAVQQKFDALPDACLTTRVWKAEAEVIKSYGRAAAALESEAAGKWTLEDALAQVARAFGDSPETYARRTRLLEDLCGFVETVAARERVRAYLTAAEPTGIDELETARRELLGLAHDSNNFSTRSAASASSVCGASGARATASFTPRCMIKLWARAARAKRYRI